MRSSWIRVDPKNRDRCPYKRREDTQRDLMMGVEIKVIHPQAKKHQG
jgi:hypothetical protein